MSSRGASSYRAKLFQTGGSQAVRLPKQCRLPGTEVMVRKAGGALVLEPVGNGWSPEFVAFLLSPREIVLTRPVLKRHEREDVDL